MEKETQQKMQDMQVFEQNIQGLLMQRQNFNAQLSEIDAALNELKTTKEAYKLVGGIMVLSKKEELIESLNQRKKMFELRLNKIGEQEKAVKEKANKLQSDILSEMGSKNVKK
ncbi:prefoldin subunit [Candidatus Woesearchaeota archaeon]|jgi:prefoldin beta subunit|nr:prefoldin subunit [Candidatus Woesearchaeota archaeon]